jgi:hypothetical protein
VQTQASAEKNPEENRRFGRVEKKCDFYSPANCEFVSQAATLGLPKHDADGIVPIQWLARFEADITIMAFRSYTVKFRMDHFLAAVW